MTAAGSKLQAVLSVQPPQELLSPAQTPHRSKSAQLPSSTVASAS